MESGVTFIGMHLPEIILISGILFLFFKDKLKKEGFVTFDKLKVSLIPYMKKEEMRQLIDTLIHSFEEKMLLNFKLFNEKLDNISYLSKDIVKLTEKSKELEIKFIELKTKYESTPKKD